MRATSSREMRLILQQEKPDDYLLATGKTYSEREFVEFAFARIGHRIEWRGRGVDEEAIDAHGGDVFVAVDPRYFPADRGRSAARRSVKGAAASGLASQDRIRRPGA